MNLSSTGRLIQVFLIFIFALLCDSCQSEQDDLIEEALSDAGANGDELRTVLGQYEGEKHCIAKYLIASMPLQKSRYSSYMDSIEKLYRNLDSASNWAFSSETLAIAKEYASRPLKSVPDVVSVESAYLIETIEDAYALWKTCPWNRELPINQFCELLLPYRIGDETISRWRGAYREYLHPLADTLERIDNSVDAARIVAAYIGPTGYNDQLLTPHRNALNLLEMPVGYCREYCDRTVYAMRSVGIPVTIDMMPVSPDNGLGHQWTVVYDTDNRIYRMFDNKNYLPTRERIHNDGRSKGKVYRRTLGLQLHRYKHLPKFSIIPSYLKNPRLMDVTAEYFGKNEAKIEVVAPDNTDIFLGLYTRGGFKPVDVGEHSGKYAVFHDIEPRIIFFPLVIERNKFVTCGFPFMLREDNQVQVFKPKITRPQTMSLTRKMPMRFNNWIRLGSLVGITLQHSSQPVGPWINLHTVIDTPRHCYYRVPLSKPLSDKNLRIFRQDNSICYMGELIASRDSMGVDMLDMTPVSGTRTADYYANLVDKDILSHKDCVPSDGDMIFRIETIEDINNIFILPHNDDNYVVAGQTYELCYRNEDSWVSVGRKKSDSFHISFTAPDGAVLLLRNLTKGQEEQVFIWEDGRQKFNIDL